MEPQALSITRDESIEKQPKNVLKERHPGDGSEDFTIDDYIKSSNTSYKNVNKSRSIVSPKSIKTQKKKIKTVSAVKISSLCSVETTSAELLAYNKNHEELLITIDTLKTQLKFVEDHNNQLIEEKMKLSQQLGIQTQVNNEVKKLLVASIGEDLQLKYERLILDKSQTDLEIQHLHNVLEEDREEVEQAMIQADVWRSKFLASRVMSDELARWKSALYYKYKESYHALQNLLEEHSKIRALNNATKRGLTKVADLLNSKDPSLDSEKPLTTIDVAFMNNDLVNSLLEIMMEQNKNTCDHAQQLENNLRIEIVPVEKQLEKCVISNDVYKEATELTHAEQLAHEVIINTGIETEELCRMRNDYLAHNRISHFLSTNYHVNYNCCDTCIGPLQVI